MSSAHEVAVFGGSFDPPHVAHVLAVAYALSVGNFDQALVIPVFVHAFAKPLSPFEHRVAMTRLALSDMKSATVSTVEQTLATPNRTLVTLEHLKQEHPEWRLRLVIGADVLLVKDEWLGFERIERLAPPFVLGRAGIESQGAPPAVLPEVSSTRVRELLSAPGRRAEHAELGRLVPRSVLEYIDEHGLYR